MEEKIIPDISKMDYTSRVTVQNPENMEACVRIKQATNARICVGRAGCGYRTENYLRYLSDHAAAMDSVWAHVDESIFEPYGFVKVQTTAENKEEYIKRPDKGKVFSAETEAYLKENCRNHVDVQIVVADGLSAYAIENNAIDVYEVLVDGLKQKGYSIGTPIFVRFGRVATMDHISELLDAKVTILLVGERPGLITNKSMSCYMAYESSTQKPESQRTVISNIYDDGTPAVEAAAQIVGLTELMMEKKCSGSLLKV